MQYLGQFPAFWTLLQRSFWRERSAVMWTFLFPVFLMLSLGALFSGAPGRFAAVGVLDDDGGEVGRVLRAGVVRAGWAAGPGEVADAVVRVPAGATARSDAGVTVQLAVSYQTADPQKIHAIDGLLSSIVLRRNAALEGAELPLRLDGPPLLSTRSWPSAGGFAEFLLFGLVGLNVLSTALFGVGVGSSWFRENGVLRRFWLTPAEPRDFLCAQLAHIASLLAASTALLVLTGHLLFDTPWPPLGAFLVVMTFGSFALIPIGLAIAARTTKPQTTQMCANLVYFPLMLLSGVYFRAEIIGEPLSTAMRWLPLKPFLDALRAVSDGVPLVELGPELGALTGWGVAGCALARGVFRWNT